MKKLALLLTLGLFHLAAGSQEVDDLYVTYADSCATDRALVSKPVLTSHKFPS